MSPPDWSWPELVEARAPDFTMDESGGLGGPEWEEELLWPWLLPLWWLEDW